MNLKMVYLLDKARLYCYKDAITGELIRKASGVVAAKLSYDDFVNLAKGFDVLTNKEIFKVNWETLTIEIVDTPTKLKGLDKNARLNISANLGDIIPADKTMAISYPNYFIINMK